VPVPPAIRTRSARGAADWRRAATSLAERHPFAAVLLERHGAPEGIRPTPPVRRFESLAESIVYQQLHGRAAATIWSRVCTTLGPAVTPEAVLASPVEELRGAGLSAAKATAVRDLARCCVEGVVDLARTGRLSDPDVVEHLCVVRGIGPWTAQMYLLFDLGRLDVWPTGDLGVRNGWARAIGATEPLGVEDLAAVGEQFAPYRSVLAWWCWRETDVVLPDGP